MRGQNSGLPWLLEGRENEASGAHTSGSGGTLSMFVLVVQGTRLTTRRLISCHRSRFTPRHVWWRENTMCAGQVNRALRWGAHRQMSPREFIDGFSSTVGISCRTFGAVGMAAIFFLFFFASMAHRSGLLGFTTFQTLLVFAWSK